MQLMLLDTKPDCLVCGESITETQKARLRYEVAGSNLTAIVHSRCAKVIDRTAAVLPALVPLIGIVDDLNRRFTLPDNISDGAPIFLNGLCQLDGDDFFRIGRIIILRKPPNSGDNITALRGNFP